MKRLSILAAILIVLLTVASPVQAHFLWLNSGKGPARVGQPLPITIGWGHCFPVSEKCDPARLLEPKALSPIGEPVRLIKKSPLAYALTPTRPGTYLVLAAYEPGFLTKTTQGYKHQDKKGLKEVLFCFRYDLRAKALVTVEGGAGYDQRAGDVLEITPLVDVSRLKTGDTLPVKVWFRGKPLPGAEIEATYAGFSQQPNQFAFHGRTDAQGVAKVKLLGPGVQLIAVTHKEPYPDKNTCDQQLYRYTLTFHLR